MVANASVDGLIRLYKIDRLVQPHHGQNQDVFNRNLINDFTSDVVLEAHQDAIWSIALHSHENILLSCSSDSKLRYTKFVKHHDRVLKHNDSGSSYETRNYNITSLAWSQKIPTQFYAGATRGVVVMYDLNVNSPISNISYQGGQLNKIKAAFDSSIIYGACDDGVIRSFDSDSNQIAMNFVGHSDSVSSISLSKNGYNFVSCGHDGKIILWDCRKSNRVCELAGSHYNKYDECIYDVLYVDSLNFVVSAGADGDVNFYQLI